MAGVLCQEGQELTHEGSWLYVNEADMKVVNRGTFTTGGFSPYCTSGSYVSTFTNEGTMNFDGTNDEYATFHVQNFMNSGKLVIDSCYSFMVDGSFVNTGTIFLSDIESFTGQIDNSNGTIVYDHNSTIGARLLDALKNSGGTVITKEEYEQVKPQTFSITYELNGGTYIDGAENPSEYVYDPANPDAELKIPNQPIKKGCTFMGWHDGQNNIGVQPVIYTIDRKSKALSAIWEENRYEIHYELDGGVIESGDNPVSYTVSGESFTLRAPVKPGYRFDGWTGSNGQQPQDTVTVVKGSVGNLTFRANWTPRGDIDYAVKIYYQRADGTYSDTPDKTEAWKGETNFQVTISAATYIREGFEPDTEKSQVSGTVVPDGSLCLTMYYKRKTCQLSFFRWDNTVAAVETAAYGTAVKPPEIEREAEADYTYEFLGWAAGSPDGDIVSEPITAEGDCSYYTVFKSIPNFRTITFETTNGFVLPENPVLRVMKGEKYEISLGLENEFYCIGTPEWGHTLREYHIYGTKESGEIVTLQWNEDFFLNQDGFGKPVVLTIPKVEYDLTIILCPKYHEEHDYWVSEIPSTETAPGKRTEFCYFCGKTIVTELPVATELPGATEPPAGTPVPTQPAATFTPEATQLPVATKSPEATELPVPTKSPETTEPPAGTPVPTQPAATFTPQATNPPLVVVPSPGLPASAAPTVSPEPKSAERIVIVKRIRSSESVNRLKWKKVNGADGYRIYAARCGGGRKLKKVKEIKSGNQTVFSHKKLKKNTYYRYRVVAYKNEGKIKKIIGRSLILHTLTEGSKKYGNPRRVSVRGKKLSLAAGASVKISASVHSKGKKIKRHVPKIRYVVSDPLVAGISPGGRLQAKKKGNCRIYAVAQNGAYVSILCRVHD